MMRTSLAGVLLAVAPAPLAAQLDAPGPLHGNWRMTAADDPGDNGLMAVSLQLGRSERHGSGDYAMHQPMCSFLDGGAIRGDEECELGAGIFASVERKGHHLLLTFLPTADGMTHRLILVRRGARLVGTYRAPGLARRVILEPAP